LIEKNQYFEEKLFFFWLVSIMIILPLSNFTLTQAGENKIIHLKNLQAGKQV